MKCYELIRNINVIFLKAQFTNPVTINKNSIASHSFPQLNQANLKYICTSIVFLNS